MEVHQAGGALGLDGQRRTASDRAGDYGTQSRPQGECRLGRLRTREKSMHAMHASLPVPIASIPRDLACMLSPLQRRRRWTGELATGGLLIVIASSSRFHLPSATSLHIFFVACRKAGQPSWLFHSALATTGDTAWGWCRVLRLHPAIAFYHSAISSISSVLFGRALRSCRGVRSQSCPSRLGLSRHLGRSWIIDGVAKPPR